LREISAEREGDFRGERGWKSVRPRGRRGRGKFRRGRKKRGAGSAGELPALIDVIHELID
jgi:hypothetical protein